MGSSPAPLSGPSFVRAGDFGMSAGRLQGKSVIVTGAANGIGAAYRAPVRRTRRAGRRLRPRRARRGRSAHPLSPRGHHRRGRHRGGRGRRARPQWPHRRTGQQRRCRCVLRSARTGRQRVAALPGPQPQGRLEPVPRGVAGDGRTAGRQHRQHRLGAWPQDHPACVPVSGRQARLDRPDAGVGHRIRGARDSRQFDFPGVDPGAADRGLVRQQSRPGRQAPRAGRAVAAQAHRHAGEVAYTALFLASDEARFINATDILVDGGRSQLYHE